MTSAYARYHCKTALMLVPLAECAADGFPLEQGADVVKA